MGRGGQELLGVPSAPRLLPCRPSRPSPQLTKIHEHGLVSARVPRPTERPRGVRSASETPARPRALARTPDPLKGRAGTAGRGSAACCPGATCRCWVTVGHRCPPGLSQPEPPTAQHHPQSLRRARAGNRLRPQSCPAAESGSRLGRGVWGWHPRPPAPGEPSVPHPGSWGGGSTCRCTRHPGPGPVVKISTPHWVRGNFWPEGGALGSRQTPPRDRACPSPAPSLVFSRHFALGFFPPF